MTAIEDSEEDEAIKPAPWSWARLAGIAITAVGNVLTSVAVGCTEVSDAVSSHLAFHEDRRGFAVSVSQDINRIAAGDYS